MDNKKKISKLSVILSLGLIISLVANIVMGIMVINNNKDSDKHLYDPNYALGRNSDEEIIEDTETEKNEEIPLQIIKLYYSEDLKDRIEVEVDEKDNHALIRFIGTIFEKKLELFFFELTSDNNTGGFILGTLNDSQYGELYVVMHMNEQNPEDWTEDEYNEICNLQERVNDFIVQFYEDERFIPSH